MTNEEIAAHNLRQIKELDEWKARQRQGYVYFLRAGNTVKIGFSRTPKQRLEKLRIDNAFPVFICKLVKGSVATERSFHRRFVEYRIRGEWFDLRGSLAKYLERHIYPITDLPDPASDPKPERDIIL